MSLTDEEFNKKTDELVGDLAVSVYRLIHGQDPPSEGRLKEEWSKLSRRLFELADD